MQQAKWYVSRQMYWPDGDKVVEIAFGGREYANPDKLSDNRTFRRLGSGSEYEDPREAVKAAIRVRDEWAKDTEGVRIETGFTHGFTLPFDECPSDAELIASAHKEWAWIQEHVERCAECGDPIWSDTDWWYIQDLGVDVKFCSEACVDNYYYTTFLDQKAEEKYVLA